MNEQEYIKRITEAYGPKAYAVYEACMAEFEEGLDFGRERKFLNACNKRMQAGDPKALRDMAGRFYDMTGRPDFMLH